MIAGSSIVAGFTTRFVEQEKDVGTKPEGVVVLRLSLAPDIITAQRPIRLHPDYPVKIGKVPVCPKRRSRVEFPETRARELTL